MIFLVLSLAYLAFSRLSPFNFIDDAYISFRYAENLAQGRGLVYNLGERVEGYSTTLFVLLLAALARFTPRIPLLALFLGLVFHAGMVALAAAFLRRFVVDRLWAPLPFFVLAFLAFHPTGVGYAESGMETSLASFLLLLAVYFTAASIQAERSMLLSAAAGVTMVLAALTRPEMILLAAPFGLWLLFARGKRPVSNAAVFGLVTAIGFGLFLLWRHWYFGEWQPNTYYAKAAGAGLSLTVKGLRYLGGYVLTTLFPLALLVLLAWLRRRRAALPSWWHGVLAVASTHLAAIVYVGGDHFPLSRFFVPITPLLLLLLAQGGVEWVRRHPRWGAPEWRPLSWMAAGMLLPATIAAAMLAPNQGIIFIRLGVLASNWCGIGRELAQRFPPDTSVALIPIGAVGYCSKLPIVDLVGLTDKTIARTPTDLSRSLPGHGRYNSRYVLTKKKPQLVLLSLRRAPFPAPLWAMRRALFQPADIDLARQAAFARDYAFHRLAMEGGYLHYCSRRDFEDPVVNPGVYPVAGVENPLPETEPPALADLRGALAGNLARAGSGIDMKWYEIW